MHMIEKSSEQWNIKEYDYIRQRRNLFLNVHIYSIGNPGFLFEGFYSLFFYFLFNLLDVWRIVPALPPTILKPEAVEMNMRYGESLGDICRKCGLAACWQSYNIDAHGLSVPNQLAD